MENNREFGFRGGIHEKVQEARAAVPLFGRERSYPQHLTVAPKNKTSRQANLIHALLLAILLIYATGVIRIVVPLIGDLAIVYRLRVIEEYVVLLIISIYVILNRSLILTNITPTMFLMAYFIFASLANGGRESLFIKFIIFWYIHYIAFINIMRRLDKRVIFFMFLVFGIFISCVFLGIGSRSQEIMDPLVRSGRRFAAEQAGMQMNVNTVSMLVVGISTILVVMKQNLVISKRVLFLLCIYHVIVLAVLFVNCSIGAFLFFILVLGYDAYKTWRLRGLLVVSMICIAVFSATKKHKSNMTLYNRLTTMGSIELRIVTMKRSISLFKDNPAFGIGHSRHAGLQEAEMDCIDHNFYTKLLASEGIFGFCAFICFAYTFLRSRGKSFAGIYLLRSYWLFFLTFVPSVILEVYTATLISELSRPCNVPERVTHAVPVV